MEESWQSAILTKPTDVANRKDSETFYEDLKWLYGQEIVKVFTGLSSDVQMLHTNKNKILARWKEQSFW